MRKFARQVKAVVGGIGYFKKSSVKGGANYNFTCRNAGFQPA